VRALLFAVAVALLVSPALAASSRADGERPARGAHKLSAMPQWIVCPRSPVTGLQPSHRRQHAAGLSLGGAPHPKRRAEARTGIGALAQMTYAVQLKAGLSKLERAAALSTLRHKYKLTIVKINKGLDILRVAPRVPPKRAPKSLGAALTPKAIQDLRKEPFVDAAYVDFPVNPTRPRPLKPRSKPRPAR
jgi:hypothetical protein